MFKKYSSLSPGYWLGFGLTLFSVVCGILLAFIDNKAEKSKL